MYLSSPPFVPQITETVSVEESIHRVPTFLELSMLLDSETDHIVHSWLGFTGAPHTDE